MTTPNLDLKTIATPSALTLEQVTLAVRTINDNQRRLMAAWSEMRKQVEALQVLIENARLTGGF